MGLYQKTIVQLTPNERKVYETSLHWVLFIPSLSLCLLGLAWSIFVGQYWQVLSQYVGNEVTQWLNYIGLITLLLGGLKFLAEYILHKTSIFIVTNQRVIIETGVLKRTSLTLILSKVEGLKVIQTLRGRILGYGSLFITGTGGAIGKFHNLRNPNIFSQQIQMAQHREPSGTAMHANSTENAPNTNSNSTAHSAPPLRSPKHK